MAWTEQTNDYNFRIVHKDTNLISKINQNTETGWNVDGVSFDKNGNVIPRAYNDNNYLLAAEKPYHNKIYYIVKGWHINLESMKAITGKTYFNIMPIKSAKYGVIILAEYINGTDIFIIGKKIERLMSLDTKLLQYDSIHDIAIGTYAKMGYLKYHNIVLYDIANRTFIDLTPALETAQEYGFPFGFYQAKLNYDSTALLFLSDGELLFLSPTQ